MSRGGEWVREHLSIDGLHPNVQGYQALFHDVISWKVVQPVMMNNQSSVRDSAIF